MKYRDNINLYSSLLQKVKRKITIVSNLRLAIALFTLVIVYYLYKGEGYLMATCATIAGIATFISVAFYHDRLFSNRAKYEKYIVINTKGIQRLTNDWQNFEETGEDLVDANHPYTTDLDVFGAASLFQWIGATHTFFGKKFLASSFRDGLDSAEAIIEHQKAIQEVSQYIDFRQEMEVEGLLNSNFQDPSVILEWAEKKDSPFSFGLLKSIASILPLLAAFSFASAIIYFQLIDIQLPKNYALVLLCLPPALYSLQIVLFVIYSKKSFTLFSTFSKKHDKLKVYADIIRIIEGKNFTSPLLRELHGRLANAPGRPASQALNDLSKLITSADLRYSPIPHFILNVLWLWDIKCAHAIEKWKEENGNVIRSWLETIGHFEKFSSLSTIHFDNPSWVFPTLDQDYNLLQAEDIGHPLIHEEVNVGNNFTTEENIKTIILSGSNMSGKSTFLRSIALNLVLAYAGAPVCARKMKCGIFKIITSMRTPDNLQSNVSTFYSELSRIKKMVDLVESGEKTIYFIDEIFNGTNSRDRLTGATKVLGVLQAENSLGFISTHDLELCNLAHMENSRFINYHFREYYEDDAIKFDYTLYPGQSTTRNALFLIQMAGIPIG